MDKLYAIAIPTTTMVGNTIVEGLEIMRAKIFPEGKTSITKEVQEGIIKNPNTDWIPSGDVYLVEVVPLKKFTKKRNSKPLYEVKEVWEKK